MRIARFYTESDVDDASLTVCSLSGRQTLSRPYEYEVELSCDVEGGLSPDDCAALLASPCRVELTPNDGSAPFVLAGVLRRLALEPMRDGEAAFYRAFIVPTLYRTSLAYGSRIFQEMTWPEIVAQVLTDHGVTHELRLDATYPTREYTVQYEESDLEFVSRLLEHWGIFYFFEHEADGEKMVIADSSRAFVAHPDHETITYYQVEADDDDLLGIRGLGRNLEIRPAMVDLKDYNWRHPQVTPEGEHAADEATGHGTRHVYGEHIKDPTEGAQLAAIRAEQLMVDRETYSGRTGLLGLLPGHKFLLNGYPSGDLDQDYLLTSFQDTYDRAGTLERVFQAIPYEVPFRPQCTTPEPKVVGTTHAHVDGEVDDIAAPIDESGRYKLLFPFDRVAVAGGKASRWVRMAQGSTGANYGMHFPLHIGCEVAVMHVGGDPDRPIIIGAVPNAETVSPVTQLDATKSRIRTRSGILMEMEDGGD